MTNLQTQYLIYRQQKQTLENEASIPALRMLNFLRRVEPKNYVKYRLWGDKKQDSIERFVLDTESTDSLDYRGTVTDERSGNWEYFSVPFSYLDAPDKWEHEIESLVKADRKLVGKALKELFGGRIKKKEYKLLAFPCQFGDNRFIRVLLHCKYENYPYGRIKPNDPVLATIVSGHHEGFVYDRQSSLFYLDGWVGGFSSVADLNGFSSVVELIDKEPELAKDRIFRGTEVNSALGSLIRSQ